ncbi:MAG: single-stranded-DNA-specific exonuclease RecJ, partial [Anaerolineales bacterium]
MTISKKWQIESPITAEADRELSYFPPLFRQLFFNRGYATEEQARNFLKAHVPFSTSSWQLKGMEKTVLRIGKALDNNEPIIVYGDYDVDGVTATALLVEVIQRLGGNVKPYIPNRFDEGYGLNMEALDSIHNDGFKVVITVDCGIRSLDEVRHAAALGLDVIISDHHHPGSQLPEAYAVINPKQVGDQYPDKDLAGVGVAFKIAEALLEKYPNQQIKIHEFLDLVVLGTVADLAPLVGENRRLVR